MQAFNLDNNTFQLKFPRPSSKSQPKPPKDLKVESITQKECIIAKDIPRKILSDISNPNLENTQNDKSFIGGYQENINTMLIENEKMRRKIEFLQIILENTLKFDESRNVFELKNFVRANYKRFHGILDEIYTYKEEIVKTQELYILNYRYLEY